MVGDELRRTLSPRHEWVADMAIEIAEATMYDWRGKSDAEKEYLLSLIAVIAGKYLAAETTRLLTACEQIASGASNG